MTSTNNLDRKAIGITVALTFIVGIVVGTIYWAGHPGDTAGKGKSSAPSPQTTGSGVKSRAATGPDTSSTGGR